MPNTTENAVLQRMSTERSEMTKNVKSLQRLTKFDLFGFRRSHREIRANFRAYLTINAIVYGLVITGMVAAMVFPNLGATQLATLEDSGTTDLIRSLLNKPWLFSLTILGVNVMSGRVAFAIAIASDGRENRATEYLHDG